MAESHIKAWTISAGAVGKKHGVVSTLVGAE